MAQSKNIAKISLGPKLEPPDGGWGWAIVLAFGINHIFVIAVIQNFALIFADKFVEYGITITDLTLILNINSAVCNGLGLLNGPMLRRFSCRQVGVFGALLLFSGTLLTSMAVTMAYFVISFGVIFGLGFALMSPANSFSLNSYFLKKRARAMGLAVTISGFGTVMMPLTVSWLLQRFSPQQTLLIVSALVLHCVPASLLLQPVRWHMRPAPLNQPLLSDEQTAAEEAGQTAGRKRTITLTSVDVGHFTVADVDRQNHKPKIVRSVSQHAPRQDNVSEGEESKYGSLESISLGPAPNLSNTEADQVTPAMIYRKSMSPSPVPAETQEKSCFGRLVEFFDLDLLCSKTYVITSAGIALAFCAEINFLLLTPVIFKELHGFETYEIAKYQSILAAVDIVFRFLAPYLGELLHLSNRSMYLISIVILSICRALIMIFLEYEYVVAIGMVLGMAKGVRTVFMPLILPSLVPLHRLPAAIGLLMVMKAISFVTLGPLFGLIKDVTGSFVYVVIAINVLTMITAVVWLSRDFVCKKKTPKS